MIRPSGPESDSRHRRARFRFPLLLGAALLGPVVTGLPDLGAHPLPASGAETLCACDDLRTGTGWCGACERGYLAGVEIDSPALYEILDPYGHEMDPERMPCDTCREARDSDGYCDVHAIGFVGGQGFMSRLTYLLALADTPSPPLDLGVRVDAEWSRLTVALQHLDRCELCAVACYMNGRCPECNLYYRNGNAVSAADAGRIPR